MSTRPDRMSLRADAGPLLLSISVTAALARLIIGGGSARVVLPFGVAIVVADLVTAFVARRRVAFIVALVLGALAGVIALMVSVFPSALVPGGSHFLSSSWLSGQFHAAQSALANDGTPLPRLGGVVVGVGALGGAAAALTRGLWVRRRRLLATSRRTVTLAPCIAPSFALFIYSTLVSSDLGRVEAAVSYVAGALLFVTLADRRTSGAVADTTAPVRTRSNPGSFQRFPVTAVLCAAAALAVVVGAGVGLSGMRLSVFHVTPPKNLLPPGAGSNSGQPGVLLTGLDLVDDLRTVELQETHTVIFRAQSPVPTYWQVGTLSSFNGTEWVPTPGVQSALAGSSSARSTDLGPAALPSPSRATLPVITAQVHITDLLSRLLPAPPHAVSVGGVTGAVVVGDEGVLAPTPRGPGTSYTVSALLNTTSSVEGPQLPEADPALAPYLALPAEPAVVSQLAHQAVGTITTPAFEVQALVNWFRSGKFRYTLSPPPLNGPNPLVQFLTVTRAGYCQQFAGAFGVLARTLGIPTRLAVGFLAGQAGSGDTFTITGADAHVWPQVYLGPDAGWVSVEPTPSAAEGAASPLGVLEPSTGPQAAGEPTPASPPTTTPGGSSPSSVPITMPSQGAGGGSTPTTLPSGAHRTGSSSDAWVLPVVLGGLVLLALAVWAVRRRRRGIPDHVLGPDEKVVRSWDRVMASLRRSGLARRVGETPAEYIERLRRAPRGASHALDLASLADLASLVELACYTPRPCTAGDAERAVRLATAVTASRRHRPAPAAG